MIFISCFWGVKRIYELVGIIIVKLHLTMQTTNNIQGRRLLKRNPGYLQNQFLRYCRAIRAHIPKKFQSYII